MFYGRTDTNRINQKVRKMEMLEEPICVVEICKGYCCENISKIVKDNLEKLGLEFEPNGIDKKDNQKVFRCLFHNKETGICENYENRTLYCKHFFCPSAERGFMRQAMKHIENPTTNKI